MPSQTEEKRDYKYVGRSTQRQDGPDKVRGCFRYLSDEIPSDALTAVPLLSPHANAIVKSIDISEAVKTEGVCVLTYKDAPENKYNSGEWFPGQNDHPDERVLTNHARHVGDRIALVLADDEKSARKALALIKTEYEVLPAVTELESAAASASLIHEDGMNDFKGQLVYGDADKAFAEAAHVEKDTIYTPKIHHAAMETHCVLAIPRARGVIEVQTPCQIIFGVQHNIAQVLGLPLSKIKVVKANMGGTFGGKQEVVFEALAAWAALKLGRAVFINTDRKETMLSTRTRAAVLGTVETALDKDNIITARRYKIIADAGAYLTGTKKVMMAMAKKLPRLYRIPALEYKGSTVRTTTTPAGACRGYGSPQIHTITEIHTDLLCTRLGLDPVSFRLKNLLGEFEEDRSGASNIGKARVIECLERGARAFEWEKRKKPVRHGRYITASGFACCTHGNGYTKTIYHDVTHMSLRILEDGSIVLRTALHELGNGTLTAMAQIVAEVTGVDVSKITVTEGDTQYSSYDSGCQASRVIYVCGECARMAAESAAELLCSEASKLFDAPAVLKDGALYCGGRRIEIADAAREILCKNRVTLDVSIEHRPDMNPASFGAHFAEVEVDTLTGLVRVTKYLAVHDIGQAVNRCFVEGQIYGGVQMGIGMALTEELAFDRDGRPSASNFDKYHMINAPDMPEVEIMLIEDQEPGGPFGAKSIGEICTVPVSAAVVNAVNRALGSSMTYLPLTPAKVVSAANNRFTKSE